MALKRSALISRRRKVVVNFDGEVLNLAYDQSVMTPRFEQLINDPDFGKEEGAKPQLVQITCKLLKEWDLLEDDGTPMSISEEVLMDLPSFLLLAIFKAIAEDISPNATTPVASGSFS